MSDKLYLPSDIPSDYTYAQYSNGYITLYNQPSAQNETLTYYRIWYGYSPGLVSSGQTSFGAYNRTYFDYVSTSRDIFDRPDFFNILSITLLITVCGLWFFNLMTSFVRKGGLLGGLF